MSDIVERLRSIPKGNSVLEGTLLHEAADIIEAQAEHIRVLREALEVMTNHYSGSLDYQPAYVAIGRKALEGTQ